MSLFALLLLLAQDGLPPADEPSAMACTFETALRGKTGVRAEDAAERLARAAHAEADAGDERGRHERSCIFEGNFVAGDLARDTSGRRAEDQPLVHHLGERAGADERIRRRAGGAQINTRDQTERSTVRQKFENEKVETGRLAVGKLQRADPFLEPEKAFLFMARCDGVRPGDDEQPVAMLSIAAYFQPNALLIQ